MKNITGRCSCGAVEFSVPDAFLYAAYCHCSQCRRATGSSFSVFGGIADADFKMINGHDSMTHTRKSEDTEGYFCSACSTVIYGRKPQYGIVHVAYGILDDAPSLLPQVHLYTDSKAPWDTISDDLPQYAEGLV